MITSNFVPNKFKYYIINLLQNRNLLKILLEWHLEKRILQCLNFHVLSSSKIYPKVFSLHKKTTKINKNTYQA